MVDRRGKIEPFLSHVVPEWTCPEDDGVLPNVTLFWTIGPGEFTQDVVQGQAYDLYVSGLTEVASQVYVNALDHDRQEDVEPWQKLFEPQPSVVKAEPRFAQALAALAKKTIPVQLSAESAVAYAETLVPAFEFPALEALWDHCKAAPADDMVAYFHTKGSRAAPVALPGKPIADDGDEPRVYWRDLLEHFTLWNWRDAVRALQCGFDTSGPLLQYRPPKVGWPHYSGNFWWATCGYIATRQSPQPTVEQHAGNKALGERPTGRYMAEGWVLDQDVEATASSTFYHHSSYGTPGTFVASKRNPMRLHRETTNACAEEWQKAAP